MPNKTLPKIYNIPWVFGLINAFILHLIADVISSPLKVLFVSSYVVKQMTWLIALTYLSQLLALAFFYMVDFEYVYNEKMQSSDKRYRNWLWFFLLVLSWYFLPSLEAINKLVA